MTADMLCDYVWRNIFQYVAGRDRGSVALVCRRFRLLSPWVDPIRALHHLLTHQPCNERLVREIIEFNKEILDPFTISFTVNRDEIFGLLSGAASMNLMHLFDSLVAHNDFSAVMLEFFLMLKWSNCAYKALSRKICESPALVEKLLENWGHNNVALPALCNVAGEMYREETIQVILNYALKQGALCNPVDPKASKIFSMLCTNILMGVFYQENQAALVASLDRVDEIDALTADICFKISIRRCNWPAFKLLLSRFPNTELAVMQHFEVIEFGLYLAEFGNCFIEQFIQYQGGVMLFFEKVFRYYILNYGVAISTNPIIDAIENHFADAIGAILEQIYKVDPQHQSAYLLVSSLLFSLSLLRNNPQAKPSIYEFLHGVFHAAEPFLHRRDDWHQYFGFFNGAAGTDIASLCILDWLSERSAPKVTPAKEQAVDTKQRKRKARN